jgi:uncharacterized repeat protein (TIGR03803 family)
MSLAKFTQAVLLIFLGLAVVPSGAQTYRVLYTFTGGADGASPAGGVIRDSAGNLYGITEYGSAGSENGSVFRLTPKGKVKVLHSFGTDKTGGAVPQTALARDSAGNLYGTTSCGGSSNFGTVFKVAKNAKFSVLFNFTEPWMSGGCFGGPYFGALMLDTAGNLYGAGGGGDAFCHGTSCGMIFKLDPSGNETVLYAFKQEKKGYNPNPGLIRDTAGNLFGTTVLGGPGGALGTVFKLDSAGNETVLHTFRGKTDGSEPFSGLVQDSAGNLYGVTQTGGSKNCNGQFPPTCGLVFKVDPAGNETVFYGFTGGTDGKNPYGELLIDAAGNLYGNADGGETGGGGYGVFFKLDPAGNETVLYRKTATQGGMVSAMDAAGNFYGASGAGGDLTKCNNQGCGTVFEITP